MDLNIRVFNCVGVVVDENFPAGDVTDVIADPLNPSGSLLFIRKAQLSKYEDDVELRQGVAMVSDQPIEIVQSLLADCTF